MSISTLINRWFVEKKGLAMGIAFAGSGLGAMILIPITSHIIEKVNWVTAFYFLALILVAINVPVAVFLIKNRPSDIGLLPYGAKEAVELKLAGGNKHQELRIKHHQKPGCSLAGILDICCSNLFSRYYGCWVRPLYVPYPHFLQSF